MINKLDKNKPRKNRRYNGNPLAYFKANYDTYKDMNRTQLSKSDSGLYRSLVRAGQLEEAITEADETAVKSGRKLGKGEAKLSEENIEQIIKAYKLYDRNALEASRHLPWCHSTIGRYWKDNRLRTRKRKLSKRQIEKILSAYPTYNGNAYRASKVLNQSPDIIIKYWRGEGLKINKVGHPRKN